MWWRRRRGDEDFHQEIDAHIALEVDRLIGEGVSPDEARSQARRAFGNVTHAKEKHFESQRLMWLDHLAHDVRYATRTLFRRPALAASVVFTIALAIAANAALFTVFDAVLFKPLPYKDPDRIVTIMSRDGSITQELKSRLLSTQLLMEQGSGMRRRSEAHVAGGSADAEAWGLYGSETWPENFPLLGVPPLIGRWLSPEDTGVYGPIPVLIGEDLWRTRFGADASLLGQIIQLPGQRADQTYMLVGVMPRTFNAPPGANVWSVIFPSGTNRGFPSLGRLAPGATIEHVRSAFPELLFTPFRERMRPRGAAALAVLMAATVLLLIVGWVQVSALLFARAAGRSAELGVRLALGATRSALFCQFAAEGFVIAVGALAVAAALTPPLIAVLARILPAELIAGQVLTPDYRTFIFASLMSCAGIAIVALAPLEFLRRSSPLALLRGTLSGGAQTSAKRIRTTLLVGQLALTAMLLYMAGLAVHSFNNAISADFGFDPDGVVAFSVPGYVSYPGGGVEPLYQYRALMADLLSQLSAIPGVRDAARGGRVPFWDALFVEPPVRKVISIGKSSAEPVSGILTTVSPSYPKTMRLRIREGRMPTVDELASLSPVLVDRTLARRLERSGPVVGQVLNVPAGASSLTFTVFGVVDDVFQLRPDQDPPGEMLFLRPVGSNDMRYFVVRTDPRNRGVMTAIRETLERYYPGDPRTIVRLEDAALTANGDYRARSAVLGAIGVLCVPLAVAGIVGALLYAVRQQSKEIGIRLALGAEAHHIRRQIVSGAIATVGVGLALGLAAGLGAGRWMSSYLFGVSPMDPISIAGVALALLFVGWASALWPAYRASSIDPSEVLRDA